MNLRIEILASLLIFFLILLGYWMGCDVEDTQVREPERNAGERDHVSFDPVTLPTDITLSDEVLPVPAVPPKVPLERLPNFIPIAMNKWNKDIWESLIIYAAQDVDYLEQLLPTTKAEALRISGTLTKLPRSVYSRYFEMMMWRKLHIATPSDPDLLFYYTKYAYRGDKATEAQKLAYIYLWERLKHLNDAQDIPMTLGLRKTYGLSQYYIDVGKYQKAIENIKEQDGRVAAVIAAGIGEDKLREGLLDPRIIPELVVRMNVVDKGK